MGAVEPHVGARRSCDAGGTLILGGHAIKVLVVGPAPEGHGGISRAMADLAESTHDLLPEFDVTVLPSHPGVAQRTLQAAALAVLASRRVKRAIAETHPHVVHVLVGPRGSLRRKASIAAFADRHDSRVVAHLHSGAVERALKGNVSAEVSPGALKRLMGSASVVATLWDGPLGAARALAPGATCLVIGNAVAPSADGRLDTPRDLDVIYVGRLAAEKGADRLPAIAEGLAGIGATLTVVGLPGDAEGDSAARELSSASNVHMLGWVDPSEVRQLLERAKVLILPSRWEALPMSVLEAMTAGCVVVAGDIESVGVLLADGRGVVVRDEEAWVGEIARLLADEPHRRGIARRAKAYVDAMYSPVAVSAQLRAAYREAVAGDDRAPIRPGRADVLGWGVDAVTFPEALDRAMDAAVNGTGGECVSLNAAKVVTAAHSHAIRVALADPLLALADGASIVWASRFLGCPVPERVAGIDFAHALLERCALQGVPVYLLGARPDVVQSVAEWAVRRFSGLVLAGWRDGYFTDSAVAAEEVGASGARVALFAMTSPMKEAFCTQNRAALRGVVCVGVGGSFDVWAGRTRRAPIWMQKAGLEWFYRLSQEPRRLFWRYASTNASFILRVLGQRIGLRTPSPLKFESTGGEEA